MKLRDKRELANFLDTEGYIGILRCQNYRRKGHIHFIPEMTISNTEKAWVESIEVKWGGKIYPVKRSNSKWAQGWHLKIHGAKLLEILKMVRPYLQIKREQCDLTIEAQRRITLKVGLDKHRRLTQQEKDYRAQLYGRCCQLNATGPKGT